MYLEDIMLNKQARHKRTNILSFYLCEVHRTVQFTKAERRTVVARSWGWGPPGAATDWGAAVHRYRVSVWEDEEVPELDGSDGCCKTM